MGYMLALILAVTSLACVCQAQDRQTPAWPYKVEVFGSVASGRLYHGDNLWGSGPAYGVGAGVRPFSGWLQRLGIEVQAARLQHSQQRGAIVSQDLDSRLIMANVVYHFRSNTKTQPYLLGGLGHVKVDYTSRCADCVFDVDPITGKLVSRGVTESRNQASKVGVTLGAGLKIALHRHVSLRPELLFADTTPGSGYNLTWLRLQIGLGAHF